MQECEFDTALEVSLGAWIPGPSPEREAVASVAALLSRSRRPVIIAGQGVTRSGAESLILALAERAGVPVVSTLLGLGAMPAGHRLSLGMGGMHGTVQANLALHDADLVIGVGARFDDRLVGRPRDFAPGASIAHVDLDRAAFGRTVRCDLPILSDAAAFLKALLGHSPSASTSGWLAQIDAWRVAHEGCAPDGDGGLTSPAVIRALSAASRGPTTVVADVGQHQMFAAQHWGRSRAGGFFTSGGLGSMGYGLPAAMGVQLARPGELVWAVVGDGGFQMSAPELSTLVAGRIPVKVAVLNNRCLGMVRQWQDRFYDGVLSESILPQPDIAALARAHDCTGLTVRNGGELAGAIAAALDEPGPVVLDLQVPVDETVLPMVPPGGTLGEVICYDGRPLTGGRTLDEPRR